MALKYASQINPDHDSFVVNSPGKVGKTVLGATLSKLCPDELPAKQLTKLSDTLFISLDPNGYASLKHMNLEPLVADFSSHAGSSDELINKLLNFLKTEVVPAIEKDGLRNVLFDTWASLEFLLMAAYVREGLRGKDLYQRRAIDVLRVAVPLKELKCRLVIFTHNTYNKTMFETEKNNEDIERRRLALSGTKSPEILPDMCGPAWSFWRVQSTAFFPMVVKQEGKEEKRVLLPRGSALYEGGGRWPAEIKDEEPANLRKLLEKAGMYK